MVVFFEICWNLNTSQALLRIDLTKFNPSPKTPGLQPTIHYLTNLTPLRGIAAIWVAIFHFNGQPARNSQQFLS
jgi:hypothetical protein